MNTNKIELTESQKERIINDLLPFIKYTAYRLSKRLPPQLTVNDLISVGIVGLLGALQRYEEGRVKLKTFVEYRIKGAMLDELRSQTWLPRSVKKKIDSIKKAHQRLEMELGRPPEDEELAKSLGIALDEYYSILQHAHNAVTFSFEDFSGRGDGDMDVTECIADPGARTPLQILEENNSKEALVQCIESLAEKERQVLSLYYWEELTMKEIGQVLHVTEGRVCQIHNQAILRLKARMEAPVLH